MLKNLLGYKLRNPGYKEFLTLNWLVADYMFPISYIIRKNMPYF